MGRTIRNPRPDRRTRRPVAAFLRVVARHGAAMARHGRHGPPRATVRAPFAPVTGPFGFSRITRHQTRFFPVPPATPMRATPSPTNGFFTRHETRITNHGLYASLPTISRDFPAFPGISRPPHPPIKCPRAVRRSSRRPPGFLRSGESPLSHAEKGERSVSRWRSSACGAVLDQRYNFARKVGRG